VSDLKPIPSRSKFVISIAPESAERGTDGYSLVAITSENVQFLYIYLDPGSEIPWHSHPNESIETLITGEMEMWVGDEHFILRPGYVCRIPPNIRHRGIVGNEAAIDIEVFSPPRDDLAKITPEYDFRRKKCV
jgi:quercetin dioxygenase-like cupin family protein